MEVVDKISLSIRGVVPGTVGILGLKDKIQISLCRQLVSLIGEVQGGAGEKKCPVGIRVYDAYRVPGIRSIGTCGCTRRGTDVLVVAICVFGDRLHDPQPPIIRSHLMCLFEGFIDIRHRRYERGSSFNCAAEGLPIVRITPTITLISFAPSLFQDVKKCNSPSVILLFLECPCKEQEAHRIVGIGDRKSLTLPEQPSGRRHKRLAKDHRRYCHDAKKWLFVIESFCTAARITGIE